MLTKETDKFFDVDDQGDLTGASTRRADKAVFSLLKSKVNLDLGNLLAQLSEHSGLEAYKLIE